MSSVNDEQKKFWESFARVWVEQQEDLDALMAPVLDGVFDRAEMAQGQQVLDIGCGTGTSSLRAAELVGPTGSVLGADISDQMLSYARTRATGLDQLRFDTVDVAEHAFAPGSFDQVISRFGVMFFVDPVGAFTNVLMSMKPGAQLTMACWGALDANPWFQVPMYAAKEQLGAPPPVDPDAPGPLAFRNPARVTAILDHAGFTDIEAQTESLFLTPPGDVQAVGEHATSIGPARRAIEHFEASDADVAAIVSVVSERMAAYMTPDGARVPAEVNFFTARAPVQAA